MRKKWLLITAPMVALAVLFSALPTLAQENTSDASAVCPPTLGIRVPHSVPPNEEMTLAVFERATKEPVAEAGVWAVPSDDTGALRAEIAALREAAGDSDVDWQSFLDDRGTFLGPTNEEGQVSATFAVEGRYLLVAYKPGYQPAFRLMLVETLSKALGIDVPHKVDVDEEFTLTVFDRDSREPVAEAGVWAIARGNSGRIKSGLAEFRGYSNAVATVEEFEELLGDYTYLGPTNQDGQLTHAFGEAGRYFLVTFKPGYRAAFAPVNVGSQSGNNRRQLSSQNGFRLNADNRGTQMRANNLSMRATKLSLRDAEPAKLKMRGRAGDLRPAASCR